MSETFAAHCRILELCGLLAMKQIMFVSYKMVEEDFADSVNEDKNRTLHSHLCELGHPRTKQ